MTLYERLAEEIALLISSGVLRPGERIPSVRATCRSRNMSPATVMHAYGLLEDRGLISTRRRSGYYVSALLPPLPPEPQVSRPSRRTVAVDVNELVFEVLEATRDRRLVPLGSPDGCLRQPVADSIPGLPSKAFHLEATSCGVRSRGITWKRMWSSRPRTS